MITEVCASRHPVLHLRPARRFDEIRAISIKALILRGYARLYAGSLENAPVKPAL